MSLYSYIPAFYIDYGDMTVEIIGTQNNDSSDIFVKISDEWAAMPHFHTDYELHYILKGHASFNTGERKFEVNEGCFCLVPPKLTHFADNKCDIQRLTISFRIKKGKNLSSADQSEYTYYSRYFGTVKSPICCEGNSLIKCCCNKLEFYSSDNLPFSKTHISTIIRTLFLETADIIVGEMQKADQEKSVSTEISSVIGDSNIDSENLRRRMIIDTFVIENYAGDATYDKLALLLCLGRRQCIRVVRELTGETLGSLIKKQRMHTARQLIETGNMTLDEIANYVGYMSYSGFYTAYKNYYGISPGDL